MKRTIYAKDLKPVNNETYPFGLFQIFNSKMLQSNMNNQITVTIQQANITASDDLGGILTSSEFESKRLVFFFNPFSVKVTNIFVNCVVFYVFWVSV